jgi:hypothetical protein
MDSKEVVYICRDLSNGNGSDGRPFPDCVWAYTMPSEAQARYELHKRTPGFSRLAKPQSWPKETLTRFYKDCGGIAAGHYWTRKDRA